MALNDVPGLIYSKDGKMSFEDTKVGRMKREIFDATEEQLDEMLAEFGFPCPPAFGAPGMYIQTTIRKDLVEEKKKNDVVLIPVGCTEMHGDHTVSAMDTFFVTGICEGVRRYTAKKGYPTAIAMPPLMYGCHPLHHMGMPGTIVVHEDIVIGQLEDVMLGLWNDGYRKQIIVNNHGQFWVIESALQRFCKKYQLPGIFRAIDWHRAVREMFAVKRDGGIYDTPFTHADEAETSCGLYLFPDMVNMDYAVDTNPMSLMKEDSGHFDNSVDSYRRPSRWSEGEGHSAMEIYATPEGVVGHPTRATLLKAKRPLLCMVEEKLSPVIAVWKVKDVDDAIDLVNRIHAISGAGHSCSVHSANEEHILKYASKTHTSRVAVNACTGLNNAGAYNNKMPWTFSLGCGSWGGNAYSENNSFKHYYNTTWVYRLMPESKIPDREKVFAGLDDSLFQTYPDFSME